MVIATVGATRMYTVNAAVKRLAGITVSDLHTMKQRDMDNIVKILPIVIDQVKGELNRREGLIN